MATLNTNAFAVSFRVLFHDFNNNYPMCLTTETNALQCHGLGPAYGEDQGRLCFYIYTSSRKGPHGRGIRGTRSGQSNNQGWVKSIRLQTGVWHNVRLEKTRRSLSISVDDVMEICHVDDSFTEDDFNMIDPGRCIVGSGIAGNRQAPEHVLHGELSDFRIECAPPISAAAFPVAVADEAIGGGRRLTLTQALRELQDARNLLLISEEEYNEMRTRVLNMFYA